MTDGVDVMPGDDILRGVKAIAPFIGESERRTFYKCERGHISAFKEGRIWCLRKSRYLRDTEEKENLAAGRAADSDGKAVA